ncbi:MAG TPA: Type 1 glutamine amidotransferase-like domain-containing protein [Candidatus Eisenbacteria bacterium]
MSPDTVSLLGPQRFQRTLGDVLASRGIEGPVAVITAGWQEREHDDAELRDHLGGRALNLELHTRTDRIFDRDPELAAAHHERQATLKSMQELYDLRLGHVMEGARQLLRRRGDLDVLGPERLEAVEDVRGLDRRHLERIRVVHAEFESRWNPGLRSAVMAERNEVEQMIQRSSAIAIAGGHVAVLLNRLRLFDIAALAKGKPVIAWAAGAMAVSERIILFYDDPPHGPGNAEVLDEGLGLVTGIVPLPHAGTRLKLDDGSRVALFARRVFPAVAVTLDPGARVDWKDGRAVAVPDDTFAGPRHAFQLQADGDIALVTA